MHRHSPAARRFYRAFYQWSLLASPKSASRGCNNACQRNLSTAQTLRQDDADRSPSLRIIRQPTRKPSWASTGSSQTAAALETEERALYKTWRTQPAQNSAERPFSALNAWEQVIRFKADTLIMLEIAVPQDRMKDMKATYGDKLEQLVEKTGGRVEIGVVPVQQEGGGKVPLFSVLVSGGYEEAGRVVGAFGRFGREHAYNLWKAQHMQQPAHVEGQMLVRDSERSPVNTSQKRPSRTIRRPVDLGPPAHTTAEAVPVPRRWRMALVKSPAERPFESLGAWEEVVRSRADDSITLEIAVPDYRARAMKNHFGPGLQQIGKQTGAQVVLGTLPERPEHAPDTPLMCSLLVSGYFREMARVDDRLLVFRDDRMYEEWKTARAKDRDLALKATAEQPAGHRLDIFLHGKSWHTWPIESHVVRPSATITPWEFVLRSRSADASHGTLESAIPEELWQSMAADYYPVKGVVERSGADVEYGQSASIVSADGAQGGVSPVISRSVLLSGTPRQLETAMSRVVSFKDYKTRDRAQKATHTEPKGSSSSAAKIANAEQRTAVTRYVSVDAAIKGSIIGLNGTMRKTLERLSGVKELALEGDSADPSLVNIRLEGDAEACSVASGMVENVVKYAYQHAKVGTNFKPLPSGANFVRMPNFSMKMQFRPDVSDRQRRDIASAAIGVQRLRMQGIQQIQMETSCRVKRLDRGIDGWMITGPRDGIELARQKLRMSMERICEAAGVPIDAVQETEIWPAEEPSGQLVQNAGNDSVEDKVHVRHGTFETETRHPQESESTSDRAESVGETEGAARSQRQTTLPDDLRAVLRPLTHPVVLITSHVHHPKSGSESEDQASLESSRGIECCRGVTVSSFSAVTLHPTPIISFNLKVPSRTWDAIRSSGRLCVHILSATPAAAALTHAFTQPHDRPHEPFEMVRRLGGAVFHVSKARQDTRPPRIHHSEGVLARVFAKLLPEKCVELGDHVVVAAEVKSVSVGGQSDTVGREEAIARLDVEDVAGLSYARRAYRGVGEAIEVLEVPESSQRSETTPAADEEGGPADDTYLAEEDGLANDTHLAEGDKSADDTHLAEEDDADIFAPEEMHGDGSREATAAQSAEDAEFDYFRAIQDGAEDDDEGAFRPARTETRRSAAIEEEEGDYDLGFGVQAEVDERPQPPARTEGRPRSADQELRDEVDDVLGSAHAIPRDVLSTYGKSASWHNRPTVHSAQARHLRQTRYYSSSTVGPYDTDALSSSHEVDARDQVTDPSMLSQTIADFLGQSQEWVRPRRMRAVLNAKVAAERASRQLERALASGMLTEEESLRLENTITYNERRVAKSLALRAAYDLRRMLDEGRVNVRLAQWMEQAVEKGMAVVVEEAKRVRALYDDGSIDEERFQALKERLEEGHGVLNVEAMRLRQWFEDEEGEGAFDAGEGAAGDRG
ncbi:hypothetical protein LTR85_010506 [Meristemomyces frigidus]|nr:hypothetical protein LTR85_010506 [Meristemomyces frigidus]